MMIKRLSLMAISSFAFASLLLAPAVHAADVFGDVCEGAGANSTVCKEKRAQEDGDKNPLFGPDGVLTFVINLISALVGIAAVIMIILAGLKFVTSGSNPQDVSNAREMVIYAVVGLVIALSAQLIVRVFLEKIG